MPTCLLSGCINVTIIITFFLAVLALANKYLLHEADRKTPGDTQASNIILDEIEFTKTSEISVIPEHRKVTINASDDSYWDSIASESAGEEWRGVFTKNRQITLGSFCMARYPVTQELFAKTMELNPSYFKKENLHIK